MKFLFVLSDSFLAAPQVFVDNRQLSGSLGDSLFERFCDPLLLAGAQRLLQSDRGLVGRDTQEKPFDFGRKVGPPGANGQHADFVLKPQGKRRDRDLTLSGRIANHETRGSLVARQPAFEGLRHVLPLIGGMLAVTPPDHLNWRTVTRVAHPGTCEIEAQHGEEHVEQGADDLR